VKSGLQLLLQFIVTVLFLFSASSVFASPVPGKAISKEVKVNLKHASRRNDPIKSQVGEAYKHLLGQKEAEKKASENQRKTNTRSK